MITIYFSISNPLSPKVKKQWINSFQHTFISPPVYGLEQNEKNRQEKKDDLLSKINSWKSLQGFYLVDKKEIAGGILAIDITETDPSHLKPIEKIPSWKKILKTHPKVAYLQIIFVQPRYQRKHYGHKLLQKLLLELKLQNYQIMLVRTANVGAYQNFYKKISGFIPIAENLPIPNKYWPRYYFAFKLINS